MQITQQQYNSVVSGLRTQLELLRDESRELRQALATSAALRHEDQKAHAATRAGMDAMLGTMSDRMAVIGELAAGGEPKGLFSGDDLWSPAYAAVLKLRTEVEAARSKKRKSR